jgi:hypothetical protein
MYNISVNPYHEIPVNRRCARGITGRHVQGAARGKGEAAMDMLIGAWLRLLVPFPMIFAENMSARRA